MNNLKVWLSGLLVVQVLLVAAIFIFSQTEDKFADGEFLVPFSVDSVNKMVIESDDSSITLVNSEDGWLMPESKNLPAHSGKVEFVLTDLHQLKNTWPITTTASAHDRFEVGEEVFKRRVTLFQDGRDEVVVYIGTSPSFRKSHFRPQGDDNVYAMNLNVNDFYDNPSDWLDKRLLAIEEPTEIQGADYVLVKQGDAWKIKKPGEEELLPAVTAKVEEITLAMAAMELLEIAEPSLIPDFSGEDYHQITVSKGEEQWVYDLKREVAEYFIKRNDIDEVFVMSKMDFKGMSKYSFKDLVASESVKTSESSKDSAE